MKKYTISIAFIILIVISIFVSVLYGDSGFTIIVKINNWMAELGLPLNINQLSL